MGEFISRSEQFIEKYQKRILYVLGCIIVVVVAIFAINKWMVQPRAERAASSMFAAEQWFAQDSLQLALNGNDQFMGFYDVIDKYGSTKSGNLAKYYAGVSNLRLGNYSEAEKWLKKYKGHDTFTKVLAVTCLGDAAIEQGKNADALKYYMKAAKMDDNSITTPMALMKAGRVQLMNGNYSEAVKLFKKIKDYPESTEYREADKYIALAEESAKK
ncbi:MAG: tetratricopeptide repeat protein [Bacteroidales bacterium]|nr:tetratricopeptide repeat protein [Bacteroidales bacterium]